jgi:peroxiredoxin (alkyl hydroperoxide reductase subunit C)
MSIQIGKHAPDQPVDVYMRGEYEPQRTTLSAYRGRWLVLFFYPRDFTFVCPTELQSLAELHPEFEREDAVVLAASTDSFYSHKAWYETDPRLRDVSYPVLADTAHTLAKSFGVLLEDGTAMRGTFIIDPHGIVRHVQVNDLSVGRNPEETLRTLQALRTGELCPVSWRPGERTLSAPLPLVA